MEFLLTLGDVICKQIFFKSWFLSTKKWPNDPWIWFKSSSNLLKFLERDMDLEEELKEFEGEFEKDEVVEV